MSPTITRHDHDLADFAADTPLMELDDVQGFVLRGNNYPHARYCFLRFGDMAGARRFVAEITPVVTDSHPEPETGKKKPFAINIAFTWRGLAALGIPSRSLESFPPEFREGMRARARLLHDTGTSDPEFWDEVWRGEPVHCWYGIHSRTIDRVGFDVIAHEYERLQKVAAKHGVTIVGYDDGGMLTIDGQPSNKEHFGFSDGFSNPDIAGSGWPSTPGGGKPDGKGGWSPIAPGEVVLGQRDEAGEVPDAPKPIGLSRNGTFMVYRKLEEKVYTFRSWLNAEAEKFPGGKELLAAKLVGRWRDGAPLVTYPSADGHPQMTDKSLGHFTDYSYASDPDGARCPMGAHTRRVNPRDSLGFDGTLVNRHRIVRRGLNYGEWVPEGQEKPEHDSGKGVLFMVIGASIERQFEFVQTEWVNYGNDFLQGNDPDPMIGNHGSGCRMVVQGDAPLATTNGNGNGNGAHAANGQESVHGGKRRTPWICANLPQFVATRGGDYFFMPSLTALRLIAAGRVESS